MKTCPNCKTTGIPDEAKFCPKCGRPILSPAQKERILQEKRRQLKREAEKAWEAYPDKPLPKKNPYWIWWRIALITYIIAAVVIGIYLWNEYGISHTAVPEELSTPLSICAYVLPFIIFIVAVKSATFDANTEVNKAKNEFIADYISRRENEN